MIGGGDVREAPLERLQYVNSVEFLVLCRSSYCTRNPVRVAEDLEDSRKTNSRKKMIVLTGEGILVKNDLYTQIAK